MSAPVLRVDLDQLAANLRVVRARIAPAELMLVVKDNAYGHGLEEVVRRADDEGVTWFGAFDVATAHRVRAATGWDARVFTWLPIAPVDLGEAVELELDIGVGDVETLDELALLDEWGSRRPKVHLEVDSGLHRGGARSEDWDELVAAAVDYESDGVLEVVGVFSHLAEASDVEDDAAREAFDAAVAAARAAGLRPQVLHLAASAASSARREFRYDLCRVGAFAYGIRPDRGPSENDLGIAPIATLEAEVVAVSDVAVTLGIGAAQGIPSLLGRRATVATTDGPRRVEYVGDHQTLVAPWPSARVEDRVRLWGADAAHSATDLAELIGTIGEELAVRMSPRVARRYD